ncbi:MAG: hypothetical protein FWC26_04665 [Fibromonadales bacterium]|nr:hypothetical protein [Fibromonadales bacterium]
MNPDFQDLWIFRICGVSLRKGVCDTPLQMMFHRTGIFSISLPVFAMYKPFGKCPSDNK